jgi:nucleoside-diphosphate-sugar epimerase
VTLSILVTGGAGEIGCRLVRRLAAAGHRVRALVLPNDPRAAVLDGIHCEVALGDVTRPETLGAALEGIHTVYHLAAVLLVEEERLFTRVNVEGTRHVAEAAREAGVEHLIHISSASVVYPRSTPYSRSKRAAEEVVRRSGLRYTIVRPTLVYEAGGGLEFKTFADFVTRYPVVPLVGDGRALKNPVHADDLIEGLLAICGNTAAVGQLYNLCGGEEISIREMAELVLRRRGLRRPLVPLPLPLCRLAGAVVGLVTGRSMLVRHTLAGLTQDANLDRSAARRDLGYDPVGIREGIARC